MNTLDGECDRDVNALDSYVAVMRMLIFIYTDTLPSSSADTDIVLEDLIMADRYCMSLCGCCYDDIRTSCVPISRRGAPTHTISSPPLRVAS